MPCSRGTEEPKVPPSSAKPVRACICYPHTFAEIALLAREQKWTQVEQITKALGCGGGCGLCRPYLLLLLRTGETAFALLSEEEKAELQPELERVAQAIAHLKLGRA